MRTKEIIITVISITLLTSCSNMSSRNQPQESANTRTAKINAQLGIAYLEQQSIQKAKKKLLLALKQDSTIPEPWYSMAYFMETTGNPAQADQYYVKAIKVSRGRGDAENNYGTFLCRTGKYKEAVQHFVLATKDPEYLTPADAYENAGLCANRIPDEQRAHAFFDRALAYEPERPTSLMALAELDFKHGKYKIAKINLNKFLTISPPTDRSMALNTKLLKVNQMLA